MLEWPKEFEYEEDGVYYDKGRFCIPGTFEGIDVVAWLYPQPLFGYCDGVKMFTTEEAKKKSNKIRMIYLGSDYFFAIVEGSRNEAKGKKLSYFRFDSADVKNDELHNFLVYCFDGEEQYTLEKFKYSDDFAYDFSAQMLLKGISKYEDCVTIEGITTEETIDLGKSLTKNDN